MRKKSKIRQLFSTRELVWRFSKLLMRSESLAKKLNLLAADKAIPVLEITKDTIANYNEEINLQNVGIKPNEEQLDFWQKCSEVNGTRDPVIDVAINKKQFLLLQNVTIFGHTGLLVDTKTGQAIVEGPLSSWGISSRNLVKPRILKKEISNDDAPHISMLAMHNGHKHLYHFFIDYFEPLYTYLHQFYDGSRLVILVRDDISKIQQDTYPFLREQFPNITCRTIPSNTKLQVNNLIWIKHYTINRLRPVFLPRYGEFLRKLFFTGYKIDVEKIIPNRKIYISRADAKLRNILSEEEIISNLLPLGFEIVLAGKISYKEQIELFASSKVIVTAHGAALTNLTFCAPGTKILELTASDYMESTYMIQALAMQLEIHSLIGDKEDFNQNFWIDPKKVLDKVQEMLVDA